MNLIQKLSEVNGKFLSFKRICCPIFISKYAYIQKVIEKVIEPENWIELSARVETPNWGLMDALL